MNRWLLTGLIIGLGTGLVVLVAWGRRLEVQSASDPRIAQFVNAFAGGPQAPEQGGYCTNGTGRPITP